MINPKKSLGQNFLKDKNIIKKIVNIANLYNKNIIEIGPGTGALTEEILKKKPKSLYLIEKDNVLANELKLKYSKEKFVKVFNKDILDFNLEKIIKKNTVIFGNLPYNISSQILIKFIKFYKWPPKYEGLIFMFQKELGDKISSSFPSKNYGRITILTKYRLKILNKFLVSLNCFFPKPKVTSMVIYFIPKKNCKYKIRKIQSIEKVTNILFSNKRKMINKNIKKILNEQKLSQIKEINLSSRPAEINPELYYKISKIYEMEK